MIRSIPPASAHLAERPVPAPPPMIGTPGGDLARNGRGSQSRVMEHESASRRPSAKWQRPSSVGRAAASAKAGSLICSSRDSSADVRMPGQPRGQGIEKARRRPPGRGTAAPAHRAQKAAERGSGPATGPRPRRRTSAIRRPSSWFSSGVVRIRVTDGLWWWNRRPANRSGTVWPRPEVDHVERPDADHLRNPGRPAASRRSGRPTGCRRPARRPARSSSGRARPRSGRRGRGPPSPGRRRPWRGRRAPRARRLQALPGRSTHGVVTPNIVAATSGLSSDSSADGAAGGPCRPWPARRWPARGASDGSARRGRRRGRAS